MSKLYVEMGALAFAFLFAEVAYVGGAAVGGTYRGGSRGSKCKRNCAKAPGVGVYRPPSRPRCPTAKRPRCRSGYKAVAYTYGYRRLRCRKYKCKRISCPRVVRPRCRNGFKAFASTFTYHGRKCRRYVCKPYRCPLAVRSRCRKGQRLVRVPYRFYHLRCYRYRCR